jgi:hypothetical protein
MSRYRILVPTAAVLAAAAISAGAGSAGAAAAPAATPVLAKCGSVTAGGTTWQVGARGISCASAKSIVKKLGARPTPPLLFYPGSYLGMRCLRGKQNGVRAIVCLGANRTRQLVAMAKR